MAPDSFSLLDLKELTAPLTKLIDVLANATGVLYEPTRIRRKARAMADEKAILARGDAEAKAIAARAANRREYIESRRQVNLESIATQAGNLLPETVSRVSVDEDWAIEFFEQCQDIGNERMQSVWARLLAGEVATPGSFSRRTLQTVKTMDQRDADLFSRFASLAWQIDRQFVHLFTADSRDLLTEKNITKPDLMHLRSIGLLERVEVMSLPLPPRGESTWRYYGHTMTIRSEVSGGWDGILLSQVGGELYPIAGGVGEDSYFRSVVDSGLRGENLQIVAQ
jgi:uncharacterized repeat protein (TIGR03899 family)